MGVTNNQLSPNYGAPSYSMMLVFPWCFYGFTKTTSIKLPGPADSRRPESRRPKGLTKINHAVHLSWLVVYLPTPLKSDGLRSSVGMIIPFPNGKS